MTPDTMLAIADSDVIRFHAHRDPILRGSIGTQQHQWQAATWYLLLCPKPTMELTRALLWHDVAEAYTGDVLTGKAAVKLAQPIEKTYNLTTQGGATNTPLAPNRNGSSEDRVMASLPLPSPEVLRQLLAYDPATGRLTWLRRTPDMFRDDARWTAEHSCKRWNTLWAGKLADTFVNQNGYRRINIGEKKIGAHRAAWAVHYGVWPSGLIDHINGDRQDNTVANLRDVSPVENNLNQKLRGNNKTGVVGVWFDPARNDFQAYISIHGRRVWRGRFKSLDEAAAARKAKEVALGFSPNHGRIA